MNEGNIFFELKGMEEIFWVAVHCRDLIWQRIGTKCRCWFRYVIIVNRLTTFIKHACFWPFLIHRDWGDRDCCIYIYIYIRWAPGDGHVVLNSRMLYWRHCRPSTLARGCVQLQRLQRLSRSHQGISAILTWMTVSNCHGQAFMVLLLDAANSGERIELRRIRRVIYVDARWSH